MSMFKKMKERITDEVSSATNKLQNMQIIDNLAMTIGPPRQLALNVGHSSTQQLPQANSSGSSAGPQARGFNLIDDSPIENRANLNSSNLSSPQHQLFNGQSIVLKSKSDKSQNKNFALLASVNDIESDIELDTHHGNEESASGEIDLLNDTTHIMEEHDKIEKIQRTLEKYRDQYRFSLETNRKLMDERESIQKILAESGCNLDETSQLKNQIEMLVERNRKLLDTQYSSSSWEHDHSESGASDSGANTYKLVSKVRDLEKLLGKAKETLKVKNAKIQELEDSLSEIDELKDVNVKLNKELDKLRKQNDEWTVAIAEVKRTMHTELEAHNNQINQIKKENSDLMKKLADSQNQVKVHKQRQSELESKIVRMSSAHEKERDTLTRTMNASKAQALAKMQEEKDRVFNNMRNELEDKIKHACSENYSLSRQLTQTTADLEHSKLCGDRLKSQLIAVAKKQSSLVTMIRELVRYSDEQYQDLSEQLKLLSELIRDNEKSHIDKSDRLEAALVENQDLESQIKSLHTEIEKLNLQNAPKQEESCEHCNELKSIMSQQSDSAQQNIHELNAQLSLLSSANEDQEKEIAHLKRRQEELNNQLEQMRSENQELLKKNDSMEHTVQDMLSNEQSQQEQLECFAKLKEEFEKTKRQVVASANEIERLQATIDEKTSQLQSVENERDSMRESIRDTSSRQESLLIELAELKSNSDFAFNNLRRQQQEILAKILNTINSLESPESSPTKESSVPAKDCCKTQHEELDWSEINERASELMDQLCKIAVRKNSAYHDDAKRFDELMTQNESLMSETERLKEELDRLNQERKHEISMNSMEIEHLREENQILTQDVKMLTDQLRTLKQRHSDGVLSDSSGEGDLSLRPNNNIKKELEAGQNSYANDDNSYNYQIKAMQRVIEQITIESFILTREENQRLKEISRSIAANSAYSKESLPDPTEFEYLRFAVLQFMMGKEPLVLAKVISAVFKFSPEQIDQVVKAQEALQLAVNSNQTRTGSEKRGR
ncbi:Golgin subfamily A member 4 [Fragariocoptes setiger]|uniref:Golgin subfamily A member 4 n=1 Tax=Fragariocoptes setiger TaxID=1670756 RepID=A0ABQ7S8J3_9ACAR|nr:Golgin subfamily A member 4 [Fragariocoptes setiger]